MRSRCRTLGDASTGRIYDQRAILLAELAALLGRQDIQKQASALDYVPLSSSLVQQIEACWQAQFTGG
jgi:hypothetical protein